MDAGAPDSFERTYKSDEAGAKPRPPENQDDGYETSNSGDAARRKAASSPESPHARPPPPPLLEAPENMAAKSDCEQDTESASKSEDKTEKAEEDERTAGSSVSNSPKRINPPEDSNLSAEASNSQSNSSMCMRQQSYDPIDLHRPQTEEHDRYPFQRNPFDKPIGPQFGQRLPEALNFGGIKREVYEMQEQHNMYNQYRRDDQYREPYKYNKRPEDIYDNNPYKNDMYGGNFGMKREMDNPYDMKNMAQYDQSQQLYGGLKRELNENMLYNGIKRDDDPYSFVDDDGMCTMLGQNQGPQNPSMMSQMMHMGHPQGHMQMGMGPNPQMMMTAPKKRGRKKKIKDENGMEIKQEPGMEGAIMPIKPVKERKKHDRFNGMSEEEVSRRTLPDHLAENLDIIIIGINPGLFAAYKGHHYAGPGNHFWKCLYLSGLTREQMSADEDYKLLSFGIGFTNMVARATKGSADLTRREIKEGSQILLEKLQTFRPKVAVFNGKLIYEVFSGKKDFCFGKQPDTVMGTNTYMWVMPSSSARCAQLPRAADKVPFYAALKKFRDYLNGLVHHVDESELVFPDTTGRRPHEELEIRRLTMEPEPGDTIIMEDGTEVPMKKKRGRPKKIKLENGEVVPPAPRAPRQPRAPQPPVDLANGEQPPKKKRGRPKKIRPEEQQFLLQQQQNQQALLAQQMQPMQAINNPPPLDSQYNMHQNPEFQNQAMNDQMGQNPLMYQQGINQTPAHSGMPPQNMQGNQASPFYQGPHNPQTMPQGPPSGSQLDGSGPLDMGQQVVQNPGGPSPMSMQTPQGYAQSPGPYSQSPRPMGYGQSPRPPGYTQSPQRHQSVTPSYSNSPVPRPTGTPQPTPPHQSPFPSSPAQQNPNQQQNNAPFTQTSPPRPQSQNHSYSSPVRNYPYSRSPIPQNNTPTYSQPQQSPMYAPSPANSGSGQYSQPSPASQNVGYASQSPAPNRFSQSPAPMGHPYSRSPVPQGMGQHYSGSPVPQVVPFPQRSPAMSTSQGYNPSPANTPYPQHNSPASNQGRQHYSNSPIPHHFDGSNPMHPNQNTGQFSQSPPSQQNPPQEFGNDLSSEISAAISSPGPVSPSIGHIDFEPPIAANKIRVPEENMGSQENSPMGSTDMHPGSNSNSSLSDFNKSSNVSAENQSFDSQPLPNSSRHTALNLIGNATNQSSISPVPGSLDQMSKPAFGNSMYENQSPIQHEQRLGFQVPTPSGPAASPYGQNAPASSPYGQNAPASSPYGQNASAPSPYGQNASVASPYGPGSGPASSPYAQGSLNLGVASPSPKPADAGNVATPHDRLANPYGYQDGQGSNMPGSPRVQEQGGQMHQLHQHPMYPGAFNSVARSTPPGHGLQTVGPGQPSPFSPPAPAFRPPSNAPPQAGSPADFNAPKTKSQDVASKSLSGLESLVDQIPSIAEGPPAPEAIPAHATAAAPVPSLPDPYAHPSHPSHPSHPPSLYNPYSAYQSPAYGAPSNTYPTLAAAGSFVGYPGVPGASYPQLMRPTPGYLPDALGYHPHATYPAQYGGTGAGYAGPPPPNYSPYYNGYAPPAAMQNPANMPTYLSSHVLDHIHKNAAADAASSVSFGGFC